MVAPNSIPAQHNLGQGEKRSSEDDQAVIWASRICAGVGGEKQAPPSAGTQRAGRRLDAYEAPLLFACHEAPCPFDLIKL